MAAGLNALTGRASYRTLRSTVNSSDSKLADKVAGNVSARDMQQQPISRRQPIRDQADQVPDIARSTFDGGKPFRTGACRSRVADRKDRNASLAADPCEGARTISARA